MKESVSDVRKSSTELETLVSDYLASCRAARLSPKTIRFSYGYPLTAVFLPWARRNGIEEIEQLTTRRLDRLSGELMDTGGKRGELTTASVWTYMKAIRRFLAWAKAEGEMVNAEAKLPKLPYRLVEILTPAEVQRLEGAAVSERDKLIVRILADTGLRRGELTGLTRRDLLEEGGRWYLKVHGKGARDRKVGVTPALARRLRRFLNGHHDLGIDRVFVSLYRRPTGEYAPLTESGITQMITTLGQRTGLAKKVTPHVFRHTAATMMLRRGMNPLLVAQVLGHSSLQMITRVYSHLTPSDAHEALMQALGTTEE